MQDQSPIEVEIQDSSRLPISKAEAQEAGSTLALYTVRSDLITKIEDLGGQVQKAGVMRVADGFSYMTAECIMNVMQSLGIMSQGPECKGKDLHEIAKSIGYLAGAMAKQTKQMKNFSAQSASLPTGARSPSGFRPGGLVQMVVQGDVKFEESTQKETK